MKIDKSWYIKPKSVGEELTAGGVVVCKRNGEVLIALTRETNFPDFVLPKGHVEKGENLEQAAIREITEEAGLNNLTLICKLGVKERLDFKKEYWKTTHYFLFIGDCTSSPSVEWFSINNLPEIFWPEQKELIEENRQKITGLVT